MATDIDTVHTDDHYNGPRAASCIVKLKNGLCDIRWMPIVELTGYAARSHGSAMDRPNGLELFVGWRCHALA